MASGNVFITFSPTIDLETHDSGDASPLEDFITFFVKAPFNSQSILDVQFRSINNASARANFIARVESRAQPSSTLGMASILEVQNEVEDVLRRDRFAGRSSRH